jgi:hypothetical protein
MARFNSYERCFVEVFEDVFASSTVQIICNLIFLLIVRVMITIQSRKCLLSSPREVRVHFPMTRVTLLHGGETVKVPFRLVSQCNVFEDSGLLVALDPGRSSVSLWIFQDCVEAIEGKAIAMTNEN